MEGNKDQFFDMFKESFDGFAPEAPESVYTGMRSKLFWGGFTKFSAGRFNAWYLALIIGAASVTGGVCLMDEGMQGQTALMNNAIDELVQKPHNQIESNDSWDDDSNVNEETLIFSEVITPAPRIKTQNSSEKTTLVVSDKQSVDVVKECGEDKPSDSQLVQSELDEQENFEEMIIVEDVAENSETQEIETLSNIETIQFDEIDNVRFHKDIVRQLNSSKGEIVIDLVVKLPTAEE